MMTFLWDARPMEGTAALGVLHSFCVAYSVIPALVTPAWCPACQCEPVLSQSPAALIGGGRGALVLCGYASNRAAELSEPVTFCGRRRPRCFASAATTHRVESSSARSAPLPSPALPKPSSGGPGDQRDAERGGGRGDPSGWNARECGGIVPTPSLAEVGSRP